MSPPVSVSVEARGRLRVIFAQLDADACRIEAAAARLPRKQLVAAALKGKVGSERAMSRIFAGMPLQPFHYERRSAAFRYLKPLPAVPEAVGTSGDIADQQPAIVMQALLINAGRAGLLRCEPLGAAFTFHALARLLDRSAFSADPIASMFEAHNALLLLPPVEGRQVFKLERVPLPAAGGAFLASIRHVGAGDSPLAVCRTWIDRDQLRTEQAADISAWHNLIEQTAH
jgi:hypothetical protein